MAADLSVIICSYNGADGVNRCLNALSSQTISDCLEVIVVDDGSTDDTSAVAREHGAIVVHHEVNRGLAAARNSGVEASTAPVVAFLDDDCEPEEDWAEELIAAYADGIIGAGGPVVPTARPGLMFGYLARHNPLEPLELDLAKSETILYRLYFYVRSQWSTTEHRGRRYVYSFVGANMSFRREALIRVGGFDERFHFGAEDTDLCRRLVMASDQHSLLFVPQAEVKHHFRPSLVDTMRRSRAYGRGGARLYRKWPTVPPTLLPSPVAFVATLLLSVELPMLFAAAAVMPLLLYPKGLVGAVKRRRAVVLLDSYLELIREACHNVGFIDGLWRFRHLAPKRAKPQARRGKPEEDPG